MVTVIKSTKCCEDSDRCRGLPMARFPWFPLLITSFANHLICCIAPPLQSSIDKLMLDCSIVDWSQIFHDIFYILYVTISKSNNIDNKNNNNNNNNIKCSNLYSAHLCEP